MKRVLFLDTHFGSGMDVLYHALEQHPRIQGFPGDLTYDSPASLLGLTDLPHKCRHGGAIYLDAIRHNHTIAHRGVYSIPYHIFLIREPSGTLAAIGNKSGWSTAASYYRLRLRRMLSIARKAKHGIVLTHQDLEAGRGTELIDKMLHLNPPLCMDKMPDESMEDAPYREVVACQDAFERCLFGLKSLGLLFP